MKNLLGKIAAGLLEDTLWLGLFLLITRWQSIAGGLLTIRTEAIVAAVAVALSVIFQLGCCVQKYLLSYRDTIYQLSQKG